MQGKYTSCPVEDVLQSVRHIIHKVIALILRNIVPSSISYCTSLRLQYDILRGTICLNISAITLLLYTCSTKYSSL